MNPEQIQAPNHNLGESQLAAALGFITSLNQHHMGLQNAQNAPQQGDMQQTGQQEPQKPQASQGEGKKDFEQDQEIAQIRSELEALLAQQAQNGTGQQNENPAAAIQA